MFVYFEPRVELNTTFYPLNRVSAQANVVVMNKRCRLMPVLRCRDRGIRRDVFSLYRGVSLLTYASDRQQ